MSCHSHSHSSSFAGQSTSGGSGVWGCQSAAWKPAELLAMVLGFILFWPVGLAIVLWKVWQRKHGYRGDLFGYLREQGDAFRSGWGFVDGSGGALGSTGNIAFDEWREAELARLEQERRKLADAEREFSEHMAELRRARDREEFESFMRNRKQ
jgi:hypothetical protein